MSTPSTEFDPSWPEALPSESAIESVFDRVYGYETIGVIDDPMYRVNVVHDTLINNYEELTTGLHRVLTIQTDNNRPWLTGRQTSKSTSPDAPLILFHGLDRQQDIAEKVLPAVQTMFDSLMVSGMKSQQVLDRMAAMIGVLVAQSQGFSDGNTRIARAMHDFIRDGRAGISSERIFDHSRNFVVPVDIEKMIINQNVTRMVKGSYENGQFYPSNDNRIPAAVTEGLHRSALLLRDVYGLRGDPNEPFDYDKYGPTAQLLEKTRRIPRMEERLASITAMDHELTPAVVTVLRQRDYGPAAWTVAFANRELVSLPINSAKAEKLLEADRALLRMRIISLVRGMQSGGIFYGFASVEGSEPAERLRWTPTATQP